MTYRVECFLRRESRWVRYGTLQYSKSAANELLAECRDQKLRTRLITTEGR